MKFSEMLRNMLKKAEERQAEIDKKMEASQDLKEVRSLGTDLQAAKEEIAELRAAILEAEKTEEEQRNAPAGNVKPVGTFVIGNGTVRTEEERDEDKYGTPEYRKSFMKYVQTGKAADPLEMRIDATTQTTDIGAVIPTTIMNKVIEKLTSFGYIYARITKTAFKGGVDIPINALKPTAAWVGAGAVADKQKMSMNGKVSFSYYKLQCRVAVDLVADTVSLPMFEQTISNNIAEAMVKAIEIAAISTGTGTGEPLAIAKDTRVPVAQVVSTATPALWKKYETWTEYLAKVPQAYRSRCVLIMNDADHQKYIKGMVDAEGQPVARTNYGIEGTPNDRFLGREVIPSEEYLPSIDAANSGDVVAMFCVLDDYCLNTNLQMTYKRYFNENTDEWISKSTLIADGKLGDANGVVLIKKA